MSKINLNLPLLVLTFIFSKALCIDVDGNYEQSENRGNREGKLCKYNLTKSLYKLFTCAF